MRCQGLLSSLQTLGFTEPAEEAPQCQKGLLTFCLRQSSAVSITSWLLMLTLVGTPNNSTTVLPFACYKIYGTAGPGKEDVIQYNGETVFNQKTAHFAFTSPFPSRTQSHRLTYPHTFREVSHCPNFHRIQRKILFRWELGTVVGGTSRLCFTVSLPVVAVYPESEVPMLSTHALWTKAAHWALAAHVKQTGRVSKPPVSAAVFSIYATPVWEGEKGCSEGTWVTAPKSSIPDGKQDRTWVVLLSLYTSQSARICKHVTCLSCQAFSSLAFVYCLTVPFKIGWKYSVLPPLFHLEKYL